MKYLACFLMFALINTCSKKDTVRVDPLEGTWDLVSYQASRIFEEFEAGEVTLSFNVSEQVLIVENNYTEKILNLPVEGKYAYDQKSTQISIQNETFMNGTKILDFSIEGKSLTLSDKPELDGPLLILSKNQ